MLKRFYLLMDEAKDEGAGGGGAVENTGEDTTPCGGADAVNQNIQRPNFNKGSVNEGNEFLKTLPEEFRQEPSLQDIKDIAGLVKGYVSGQKMIGDRLVIPGDDATDEQWDAFYGKTGRPESFNDYDLPVNEEAEYQRSEEEINKIKEMIHKAGLSSRQAKQLWSMFDSDVQSQLAAQKEKSAQMDKEFAEEALKLFEGPEKLASAQAEFEQFVNEKVPEQYRVNMGNIDNKTLLGLMYTVKEAIAESKREAQPMAGSGEGSQSKPSILELRKEFAETMAEYRTEARKNPRSLESNNLKKKMDKITKMMVETERG